LTPQVGNKALAKELGAKGRWHADHMKEAHALASQQIFMQRNGMQGPPGAQGGGPPMPQAGGSGDQPVLFDLHGLHVAEALDVRSPIQRRVINHQFSELLGVV
jgi:hypothetical protein